MRSVIVDPYPTLSSHTSTLLLGRVQDIIKVRNGKVQGTMQDPVSKHMTTPAITSE